MTGSLTLDEADGPWRDWWKISDPSLPSYTSGIATRQPETSDKQLPRIDSSQFGREKKPVTLTATDKIQ